MTRDTRLAVIVAPVVIWAALMGLLTLSVLYAYWPGWPIKAEIGLSIGIAKSLLIALFFMQLKNSAGLVRLASMAGLVWASFLFILTFSDILTR